MRFFYQKDKILTTGTATRSKTIFRTTNYLLAERSLHEKPDTCLLATNVNNSVLLGQIDDYGTPHAYSAFGHTHTLPSANTTLGFNGELIQAVTNNYALGSGYRTFSPILMRFLSADSLSPFSEGGINAYCYCSGDPINYADPSGHATVSILLSRRRTLPTRSKLLLSFDSPAQVNTSYNRDAPPYFSSSPNVFSTAGTPPPYRLGKLPSYSKSLPKGHKKVVTPSISPEKRPLPILPKYSKLNNQPPRSALSPEQASAYHERLEEIAGQYERVARNVRELRHRNMVVPVSQQRTLENLSNEQDHIRGLLNS